MQKPLQKGLKFSDCRENIKNKFGQVVGKSSDLILCLFGFVKATKFRDSSEFSECVQNDLAKSCLPCQRLYVNQKKIFAERENAQMRIKPYSAGLVSSGFLCKASYDMTTGARFSKFPVIVKLFCFPLRMGFSEGLKMAQ